MKPLPRSAVVAALDLDDGGKRVRRARSVLVFAELAASVTRHLRERGAELTHAADAPGAAALLAERTFDAAIISMTGSGLALVKFVKGGALTIDPLANEVAEEMTRLTGEAPIPGDRRARQRHRLTPFFLVMDGEQQYSILVDPPEHSYLEDGKGISLPDAVMCLDVGKLLLRGSALA